MKPPQSRRAFLGSVATGVTATIAGCNSIGSTDEADTATRTPDESTATAGQSRDRDSGAPPQGRYADVYEGVSPSIASVAVYTSNGQSAQGSAFAYDERYLVTNEHVITDSDDVYLRFENTGWRSASVVATDVYSDLAVLEAANRPDEVTPLSLVDADPAVGTEVVAIGNPFGYSGSISAGIVSGVDRTLPAANGFSIADAIQTDAAVNPGNSGGPLVTLNGDVVGVVNSGGGDNIGFAISAALVHRVVPALIENGDYDHSYLGVTLTPVTPTIVEANQLSVSKGVYIDQVLDGTPADGVLQGSGGTERVDGLQAPVGGDVVVGMDGTRIPTRQALSTYLALETSPGDSLDVDVVRDGDRRSVTLELGSRPEPGR